jgi:hypothetical protein
VKAADVAAFFRRVVPAQQRVQEVVTHPWTLNGQQREMVFLTISSYPIWHKDLKFFYLSRTLASFNLFGEGAKIVQLLMRTL